MFSMIKRCEHTNCGPDNRRAYCEPRAVNPGGKIVKVTKFLDRILYESGNVQSDNYHLTDDGREQILVRKFSYVGGDLDSSDLPVTRTQVSILHDQHRFFGIEGYEVSVSWQPEEEDAGDGSFITNYGIYIFDGGKKEATIEEMDIIEGGQKVRPMTPYDCAQLISELKILNTIQNAERKENSPI